MLLKNKDGFGLIGIIIAITVLMIMTVSILPTFTARMNFKQAKYATGVIRTIENAENSYMAKNGSYGDLTTLVNNGYLSSNFLQLVQGTTYSSSPNWVQATIANKTVTICIDSIDNTICPNNPNITGSNGYFLGIYGIPHQFQTYIEHELPGSGVNGLQDISYVAPVPTAPPISTTSSQYAFVPTNATGAVASVVDGFTCTSLFNTYDSCVNNTNNTVVLADTGSTGVISGYSFVSPGATFTYSINYTGYPREVLVGESYG